MSVTEFRKPRGSGWVWFGLAVTIAYSALLAWLFTWLAKCPAPASPDVFVQTYFSCRSSNELGDFLAGAFAPLAFLWLVIAVLIQSAELREQRRELALTRQEMAETRAVVKAQADEAKKQAEYIGKQTELLTLEQRTRKEEAGDRHLESLATSLGIWASRVLGGSYDIKTKEGTLMTSLPGHSVRGDVPSFTDVAARTLNLGRDIAYTVQSGKFLAMDGSKWTSFGELHLRLNHMSSIAELTDVWKSRLSEVQIERAAIACRYVCDCMKAISEGSAIQTVPIPVEFKLPK